LAGLALGAVAIAASVSPPAAQGIPAPDGAAIEVATTVLDSYVGDYLFGELQLTTISRQGNQLVMKTVPQTEIPLIARGPRLFEIKRPRESVPVATIEFMADSAGRVLALVIHQNGADITMRRIDAAAAARTRVQVSNRVQNQAADPRTAAALRRFIDGVVAGAPDYAELGPQLAAETRRQLPDMQKLLTGLGPLRELGFRGVGNAGWDLYDARYERGTLQWRIVLDSAGIITGLLVNEGP
jgi:hypothetical protein